MRFLISLAVLALFAIHGEAACGSASAGRAGLFARSRERRQSTVQSSSYHATIRVSSSVRSGCN